MIVACVPYGVLKQSGGVVVSLVAKAVKHFASNVSLRLNNLTAVLLLLITCRPLFISLAKCVCLMLVV